MTRWRFGHALWGLTLVPASLVLGYIGYRSVDELSLTPLDALFASLQLFSMNTLLNDHLPWTLDVARFMAPLAVLYAAVATIAAVLRDQVERTTVALVARGHVVLVGLGPTNATRTLSLRRVGRRTVVVESDSANARIPGVRALGANVLLGDGRQSTILRRARASTARHVIIATGDDSRNLDVADEVRRLVDEDERYRTTIHVSVESPELWAQIGRLQLPRSRGGSVIEFFNPADRAAQALLTEAEAIAGAAVLDDVLIDGDGYLADRVVAHLARRAALHDIHPRVVVTPELAEQLADRPGDRLRVEVVQPDASREPALALVCTSTTDAEALTRALRLAHSPQRSRVVVSIQGQQTDGLLEAVAAAEKLRLVPATETASVDFLRSSSLELMARARHEDYVAQELAAGRTVAENPSMVAWADLPDSLKESNRRFAESIGETLDRLGATLVPLSDGDVGDLTLPDAVQLEPLAIGEHSRWADDLAADGWRYAPGPKDPARKTHPLLVPWDQLPEAEKEKDRDAIRAIPRMLARAGFAIEMAEAPAR